MQLLGGRLTVLIVVSVYAVTNTNGTILMVRPKETAIECSSKAEITFKFYSNIPNISPTIAECDPVRKCIMLQKSTENKYSVSYTGRGGILRILRVDEETTGTYRCYETFDPQNFVTTIITPSPIAIEADNPLKRPTPNEIISPIVLGTLKDTSFECASNADITFKIINNKSNTSATIAECVFTMKSCYTLKPAFKNKYNLLYTGQGGVLQIISVDDETIGTYTCYETHNPNNFVRIDLIVNSTKAENGTWTVISETSNTRGNVLDESGAVFLLNARRGRTERNSKIY
ncbi:hypothetical protein DPMN_049006 [Dreissena polymorpha]|uniref:Uncharacterized protein n=1 Tax=Dreissena polymorpha TaxID=45954 RepID=A0A9D4I2U6_DREPO|nr:hypothetical protein DPMN_049006 [Dreissena polymorpha]